MKVGDRVLAKQNKKNKFRTNFNPNPLTVTKIRGTMNTAERPGFSITRNQSFFKPVIITNYDDIDNVAETSNDADFDSVVQGGDDNNYAAEEMEEEETEIEEQIPDRRYPGRERRKPNYYEQNN